MEGHWSNIQHLNELLLVVKSSDGFQDPSISEEVELVAILLGNVKAPVQVTLGLTIFSECARQAPRLSSHVLDHILSATLSHMTSYRVMGLDCLRIIRYVTKDRVAECLGLIVEQNGLSLLASLIDETDFKATELGLLLVACFAKKRNDAGVSSEVFKVAISPIEKSLRACPMSRAIQRAACSAVVALVEGDSQMAAEIVNADIPQHLWHATETFPKCGVIHRSEKLKTMKHVKCCSLCTTNANVEASHIVQKSDISLPFPSRQVKQV